MQILVINPNSTAAMTAKIAASVRERAAAGTVIHAANPSDSPASLEGAYDEAMSLRGLLDLVAQGERDGMDAYVIACFGDPGVAAAREIASGPVIGICEAAMHAASFIANSFSIVTTLDRSVPAIEELVLRQGMERRCRRVRAAGIPVLALEDESAAAREAVKAQVLAAAREDRSDAVILGCAGMADLTEWLSAEAGLPVLDGCVAAVKQAEALVGAGLKTSKFGAYASPLIKHHAAPDLQRVAS